MEALQWKDDCILVLDQRALPARVDWVKIRNAREMADAIRGMVLRGAPLIGIAAAYALALEAKNGSSLSGFKEAAALLLATRPTAVNLTWAISRMMQQAEKTSKDGGLPDLALLEEAKKIHEEDRRACAEIAKHGAALLPPGSIVLTHCNTGALATGGDGTAYAIIKAGHREKKIQHVFACESRPYLQGARLTALELKEDGIPFTLITDSMAGHFMAKRKISAVIVGADRIAANGDIANKIGTYSLAVLAKENKIPFIVAAPTSTIDETLATGEEIPLEERSPQEVTHVLGVPVAPPGTPAAHPAFDITPAGYIQAIVTENGVASPPNRKTLQKLKREKIAAL